VYQREKRGFVPPNWGQKGGGGGEFHANEVSILLRDENGAVSLKGGKREGERGSPLSVRKRKGEKAVYFVGKK